MPFLNAIFISYILYTPCKKIEKAYKNVKVLRKRARGLAIITVYIMAILIIILAINTILPAVSKSLIDKAVADKKWTDEDIAIYEEKKSNMNYLFNFLSKEAKDVLVQLGFEDKEAIVGNKIFAGLVEGRISKTVKEISLLDQTYVKAEDGKQTVAAYLASVNKNLVITKFVRFEVGEGLEKKNEDFAAEVAAQMNA